VNGFGRYILEGKIPVPCEDLMTWAHWLEQSENRIVRQEDVGDLWVSTVFLALDQSFLFDGPPRLFETMIFRNSTDADRRRMEDAAKQMNYEGKLTCPNHIELEDGYCVRTPTWEMALEEHAKAVEWARNRMH
jgi:hypothetical protein